MIVCDIEELDQPSINYLKEVLRLNQSEEEATVNFEKELRFVPIYRPIDNIFHIISDDRKEAKLKDREKLAEKIAKKEQEEKKKREAIEGQE